MLRALLVLLITNAAYAKSDGSFECFHTMNRLNKSSAMSFDGNFAINFQRDNSFNILRAGGVENCSLRKLSSEHHGGPPYLMQVKVGNRAHYFTYSRDSIVEKTVQSEDLGKFPPAVCRPLSTGQAFDTIYQAIQEQVAQANETCEGEADKGTDAMRICFFNFHKALKACAQAPQPELSRYAATRLKVSQQFVNFNDKKDPVGHDTDVGRGDAQK